MDWTMDWIMDLIIDWIMDSIEQQIVFYLLKTIWCWIAQWVGIGQTVGTDMCAAFSKTVAGWLVTAS